MYRSVLAILLACVKLRPQTWMEIVMLPVSQGLHLRAALALLLALPVASTLSAGAALAQTKITAGMVAHGPAQWPQYIATELGWLKQDNIELDFVTAGGGAPSNSLPARSISAIAATPISPARRCRARR
jgi:ABC-type nitrate/sulfonate/bicarbonate transport system substrate-binding protein